MKLDPETAMRLFAVAGVARLATTGPAGPHVVPIVFASDGAHIVTMVDDKPKTTDRLRRIANIEHDARVAVLVDHFDEDWSRLWWVRADGVAAVFPSGPHLAAAHHALAAKYPQYRDRPPPGPLIRITVERWVGWAASAEAIAGT